MAGPPPKPPEERRRRNAPAAGEWVDLPRVARTTLPELPTRRKGSGSWSARTRKAWGAWRADPVTSLYGPADVQLAVDLVFMYEMWVREERVVLAAEVRALRDSLGLSPKGRQDRRWRLAPPGDVVGMPDRSSADRMKELRERAAARAS